MANEPIDCEVEFPSGESKFGKFANAFRVMPDNINECFIDFCVYSAQENKARVVSRIRVHRTMLAVIQQRLEQEMTRIESTSMGPAVWTPEGKLALLSTGSGDA
jgi:hypothetical protein